MSEFRPPAPTFTHLTAHKNKTEQFDLMHVGSAGKAETLATAPLSLFKGAWIQARERITYGSTATNGVYLVTLTDVKTGKVLLTWQGDQLDLWRNDMKFARPKWGICRSLLSRDALRDEAVEFADFCLAKGADECR